jgi:uncharacterized membrane protein YhiD involved in acid resistance
MYSIVVLATILLLLSVFAYIQSKTILAKDETIAYLTTEKELEKANNITLRSKIDELNTKAKLTAIDYEKRKKEYNKNIQNLSKKEAKVSNEGEDIKTTLDSIRGTDYTRLLK